MSVDLNRLPPDPSNLSEREKAAILNRLFDALVWQSPVINSQLGKVEPPAGYLFDGLIAYADGTNWDPGSGKGFYRYEIGGGTWVFIG